MISNLKDFKKQVGKDIYTFTDEEFYYGIGKMDISLIEKEILASYSISKGEAERYLLSIKGEIFEAIRVIQDCEQLIYDRVVTDFSKPQRVVERLYYFYGIAVMKELSDIIDNRENEIDSKNIKKVLTYLENKYN